LIALASHKFDFLPFYVGYGWKDPLQIDHQHRRMTRGEDQGE